MSEVQQAVDRLGRTWETYKETNDQRLKEIEERGAATAETLQKMDRLDEAMDIAAENRKRLEDLEAQATAAQHAEDGATAAEKRHRDAWYKAMANPKDREAQTELYEAAKAVTLTTTGGGNLIPTLVGGIIDSKIKLMSPMRSLARVVSSNNELTRWIVADSNSTSGWVGAGGTRSATTEPLFQSVVPTYGTVYGYTTVYEEALNDLVINVPEFLEDDIARQIASAEGAAFVDGNGTDKPTGFTTSGTPSSTADDGASPQRAFGSLQYIATGVAAAFPKDRQGSPQGNPGDVLLDAIHALKAQYRANAVWTMNATTLGVVRKWKDADSNYLYRPGLIGGQGDLFGYQVVEDEHMNSEAANAFPVAFGDFYSGYLVSDILNTMRVTVDDNITAPGNVKFYSRRRTGGIVSNDDAIKLIKCATS